MSFERIGLNKLLGVFYADRAQRISILRTDIRSEIKKDAGQDVDSGGDFHVPFWADAKRHVAGGVDLRLAVLTRVAAHPGRARLYPSLAKGFLVWWEEERRRRNVPFKVLLEHVNGRFELPGLGTIKVENTLPISVGEDGHRMVYPYFCETPILSTEAARLGLWVMSQAVKGYSAENMRILDVIRGAAYSGLDASLQGNEGQIFAEKYAEVLHEWRRLRTEYP